MRQGIRAHIRELKLLFRRHHNAMASKLLEQLRNGIRIRGYSIRTEQAYVSWAVRFIRFHGTRHPSELNEQDISAFLTHLAVE